MKPGARHAAPIACTGPGLLAFRLGQEEYGIDILGVQEIRSFEPPTRLGNAPAFILGVLNLRGVIVPVVDMRLKLGMPAPRYDGFTVVIVLNIGRRVVGMVVDGVSDVITLQPQHLLAVPELHASVAAEFLLAVGAINDRMLIVVDIVRWMRSPDMGLFDPAPCPLAAVAPDAPAAQAPALPV